MPHLEKPPHAADTRRGGARLRVRSGDTSYDRTVKALTAGDEDIVNVPVRRSELEALLHLL